MQSDAVQRLQLETDLRNGLERDEFLVYYQPLVSLQYGRIIGFEALSRWKRPQGVVSPAEFIAVADETGLILPLNRQLLLEACQQLRRWQELFPSDPALVLSVNVTAKQFAQPDLAAQISEVLQQTAIDPRSVHLEITENVAMGDATTSDVALSKLKALGVGLSIDDFGTGYSSLSRRRRFPVDTLKIDRSFISGIASDPETLEIVRVIIILAHTLGLKVIAEGIEDEQQRETLQRFGCEVGQGYLFHRPEAAPTIEGLLRRQRASMSRGSSHKAQEISHIRRMSKEFHG